MSEQKPVLEFEIYLIRHAQSKANAGIGDPAKLTIADRADPVLSETGLSQAEKLGAYLSATPFTCVYSSALKRAAHTAAFVVKNQADNVKHFMMPLLTENGMGRDYEGASAGELREIAPNAVLIPEHPEDAPVLYYNDYKDDESHFKRAKEVTEYLKSHHGNGEKICVVSHAAFITFLVFHLMGLEKTPVFDINFTNTGITRIQFYKAGTNKYGDIIFDYINAAPHLSDEMKTK